MKTDSEVRGRAQQLVLNEFDRRVAEASTRLPHLCRHNYRHALDGRKQIEGEANPNYNRIGDVRHLPIAQSMGICMLEENSLMLCDDPIDAMRCPVFTPLATKEVLHETFMTQLSDPEWIEGNMPELHALLWVLGEFHEVSLPWWKRLWFKLVRIKLDPVVPYIDPSHLLPPPG